MFYALGWFVVLSLLALWSLAAWAFHTTVAWVLASSGALAGSSGEIATLRLPDWLSPWIPAEFMLPLTTMLTGFTPAVEALLNWAPALAGGLSVAVWVVWAVGCGLLIFMGVVVSGAIAVVRRASTRSSRTMGAGRAG